MIKLMPESVADVNATLTAVRSSSRLLAGAPRQNYHLAVAGALSHLEGQLHPHETPFGPNSPPMAAAQTLQGVKDPMGEYFSLRTRVEAER